ncbi:MAG: hypothetical protein ACRDGB_05730 [Candidatus Limnocylindria bacterium]
MLAALAAALFLALYELVALMSGRIPTITELTRSRSYLRLLVILAGYLFATWLLIHLYGVI